MRLLFFGAATLASLAAGCGGERVTQSGEGSAPAPDFRFIAGTFAPAAGPDGNTEIYAAPDGLIVIDTGRHPAHSQEILAYAAEAGKPVAKIVNTHWHLDHTTGNGDLKAAYPEAMLYATRAIEGALDGFLGASLARGEERLGDPSLTEEARARLERGLNTIRERVTLLPDVAVEGTLSIPVDGRALELNVTDHAVTESDIWIWDPATKTVIAGDIVTLPVPLFDTACAEGWLAAFDAIEAKPYERVVPGHGYEMTRDEFQTYAHAFRSLVACAETKTGAECAEGWLVDAASLLDKEPEADFADKDYAKAAATYYVDEIIRSADARARFCRPAQ